MLPNLNLLSKKIDLNRIWKNIKTSSPVCKSSIFTNNNVFNITIIQKQGRGFFLFDKNITPFTFDILRKVTQSFVVVCFYCCYILKTLWRKFWIYDSIIERFHINYKNQKWISGNIMVQIIYFIVTFKIFPTHKCNIARKEKRQKHSQLEVCCVVWRTELSTAFKIYY